MLIIDPYPPAGVYDAMEWDVAHTRALSFT